MPTLPFKGSREGGREGVASSLGAPSRSLAWTGVGSHEAGPPGAWPWWGRSGVVPVAPCLSVQGPPMATRKGPPAAAPLPSPAGRLGSVNARIVSTEKPPIY